MGKILIIKGADFSEVAVDHVTPVEHVTVKAVVSPTNSGHVTGNGIYYPGDVVTLIAIPNLGYHFEEWSDGETSATRQIVVGDTSITLNAIFESDSVINLKEEDNTYNVFYKNTDLNTPTSNNDWAVSKIIDIPTGSLEIVLDKYSCFSPASASTNPAAIIWLDSENTPLSCITSRGITNASGASSESQYCTGGYKCDGYVVDTIPNNAVKVKFGWPWRNYSKSEIGLKEPKVHFV